MRIVLLDEARRRFEADDAWWREHRDNPDLFLDEFAAALRDISEHPAAGRPYRSARGKTIQRYLMRKVGCHVYYFHDREHDTLEIHSVWGARRGSGPRL